MTELTTYTNRAKEKIWNVLQEIEELRHLASTNDLQLSFLPPHFRGQKIENEQLTAERRSIILKLESLNVLTDVKTLNYFINNDSGFWIFKIGPDFTKVFDNYRKDYESNTKQIDEPTSRKELRGDSPIYKIDYSDKTREILLNGLLLAKPDFDSENERFFSYIYLNPNRTIKLDELRKANITLEKTLHKVLENLNFKSEIKTLFFDISKTSVRFKNPIFKKDLEDHQIKYIRIR